MGRWRKIIIENAAVSGRSHLPEISAPSKLEDCMGDSKKFDFRFVFWEEGGYPVWEMPQIDKGEIIVVIGPKGGLSPDEITLLKKNDFKVLSLGGFILKAEIAAIAACARIIGM
jgi:16S rRNA (uracil1498-N3)-methyltransferase